MPKSVQPGYSTVVTGDSITQANSSATNNSHGDTWATYMALASGGRMRLVRNYAIGGQRTTAIAARFPNDVLSENSRIILIATGTNDINWTTETLASLESMIQQARAKGIAVGLLTPPPRGMPKFVSPSTASITATTFTSSGTLAAGSYEYTITGRVSGGAGGQEGLPVATVPVTLSATGTVNLKWPRQNVARWHIYRRTQGSSTWGFIGGIGEGYGRADTYPYFVDNGLTPTAQQPPTADVLGSGNSTENVPGNIPGVSPAVPLATQISSIRQVALGLAQKYGLPLVDQYLILTDAATGLFKAGMTQDGVHPDALTQRDMGVNAWSKLQDMFPRAALGWMSIDPRYTGTMLGARQNQTGGTSNGALLPAVNGATAPTGWGFYGEPTSTGSITTETGIAGNIFTITGGAYAIRIGEGPALAVGTDFVAGDRIRVGFMLKVSGLDINSGAVRLQVFYGGGVTPGNLTDLQLTADVPSWSVWTAEETVPAGATTMQFRMSVTGAGVALSVAQLTMENLTRRGLVS
ncbi:SGNH/GDSL hydrolase family protein [Kineosporia succinea]|nr:GDSL-type esterase/lipase family protein [Kineosporia succinea]